MINYVLMALGIFTVLAATILIFLDKVKGEDIYFNIEVKEQEIKKVIEDADEIISELNYTSEMVVKEIEEKLKALRAEAKNIKDTHAVTPAVEPNESLKFENTRKLSSAKRKKIVNDDASKDTKDKKLNQKQQAVLEYASQGMSVTEIAKQLNIGQGEVMLILSLKNEGE